jgi:hypothetical protein
MQVEIRPTGMSANAPAAPMPLGFAIAGQPRRYPSTACLVIPTIVKRSGESTYGSGVRCLRHLSNASE